MLDKIVELGGSNWLAPAVIFLVLTAVAKGIFGLSRSKSADRKDFLELWGRSKPVSQDSLWLCVAIRHLYGENLPAQLILSLSKNQQPSLALSQTAEVWDLLEWNEAKGTVDWKLDRHKKPQWRRWERALASFGYVLLFGGGLTAAYFALTNHIDQSVKLLFWLWSIFGTFFGFISLFHSEKIGMASKVAPRWLGLEGAKDS